MKTAIVAVLLMATVASAQSFTAKFGENYASADLCLDRIGPFQVGVVVGADFVTEGGSLEDFDLDIKDTTIGPIVKLHALPEESDFVLCAEYAPMFQPDQLHNSASEIIGATASYKGFGVSYQYLLDAYKTAPTPIKDRWLLTWMYKFK